VKSATTVVLSALISFSSAAAQDPPSFGTTVVIPAGLHGTVYLIPNNTTVLPDFQDERLQRVGELWTNSLNIPPRHWSTGFPGLTDRFEWFAIDYDGKFWIDKPGRYAFALLSDDGSRLFIDNVPVIDNDCQHSPDLRLVAVNLQGGGHRLRVSYFQGPRDCLALLLAVAGPDGQWKVFDIQEFRPPSNPEDWHYDETSAVAVVPTNPAEAELTKDELFKRLSITDSPDNFKIVKKKKAQSCAQYSAVRTCGRVK
jgi:hypothetical protein